MEMKSSNYNPLATCDQTRRRYIFIQTKKIYSAVIKNDLLPYNEENIRIIDRTKSSSPHREIKLTQHILNRNRNSSFKVYVRYYGTARLCSLAMLRFFSTRKYIPNFPSVQWLIDLFKKKMDKSNTITWSPGYTNLNLVSGKNQWSGELGPRMA